MQTIIDNEREKITQKFDEELEALEESHVKELKNLQDEIELLQNQNDEMEKEQDEIELLQNQIDVMERERIDEVKIP